MIKSSADWTEQDLIALVNQQIPESTHLEYKSCGSLTWTSEKEKEKRIADISKYISAFANADGGTIIYGIIEKRPNNVPIPERIDIGFDSTTTSVEWLENIIESNINPRIKGIVINPVKLETSNPGKVAYVVYVPKTLQEPHQANDCIYYRRRNFKCSPMEHYEIMDVVHRGTVPDVHFNIRLDPDIKKLDFVSGESETFNFKMNLANHSIEPANFAMIMLWIDNRIKKNYLVEDGFVNVGEKDIMITDLPFSVKIYQHNHHISQHMPIFKGKSIPLFCRHFSIPALYNGKDETFGLFAEIAIPKMEIHKKSYLLHLSSNNEVELEEVSA